MAAWFDDDFRADCLEARGEADALDGIDPTEGFYADWRQPDPVVAALRSEFASLGEILDEIVRAA